MTSPKVRPTILSPTILSLIATTVLTLATRPLAAETAKEQCVTILYGPSGQPLPARPQGGFVTQARAENKNWNIANSPDHARDLANAVQFVEASFFDPGNQQGCQALMLATNEPSLFFLLLKSKIQNLEQSGGSSSSSGTTNLVSKNLDSELISIATEYGGMTQATSGQTTTLSGSLSSIPLKLGASTGLPFLVECSATASKKCMDSGVVDWLSKASFAIGINTGSGSPGTGTATGGQGTTQPVTLSSSASTSNYSLNQVTGKFAILRTLPTKSVLSAAAAKVDASVLSNIDAQSKALRAYLAAIDSSGDAAVKAARDAAAEALLSGDERTGWDQAAHQFLSAANAAVAAKKIDANYLLSAGQYLQAAEALSGAEDTLFTSSFKPTLSVEYDLNTPENQPSNSVFKLIGAWVPGHWTLTLNGAASIYNSSPPSSIPSASRIRDFQVAAEADFKNPKSWPVVGQPTFTAAFYYQDQTSPSILTVPISGLPITGLSSSTNQVFTQRGPIDIGQLKVSFGTSSSGVSVPLSFTVANRTELIQGMNLDWKGQIGFSYDFASLLSK